MAKQQWPQSWQAVQPSINQALTYEVVGAIYTSANSDDLSEDMLEVNLPDGIQVCAGWSKNDCAYRITATQGLVHLCAPYTTRDPNEAVSHVEQWVAGLATQHATPGADSPNGAASRS